jgi:cell division protein FtsB
VPDRRTRPSAAGDDTPLGKAGIFIKISAVIIVLFLVIISFKMFMDYTRLLQQKEILEKNLEKLDGRIDELNYYISSPMDENYVKKFAKELLGLVPPDEVIYITDGDK